MAHKTLIGGTAYEISGGKTLIDGTVYAINGGKTMVGGTVRNISFSTPISTLAVGSSVFMNVNGARTEFLVVHQGLPSGYWYWGDENYSYDSSCNGTWLLMKDVYPSGSIYDLYSHYYHDYRTSKIHSYLNDTFFYLLDSNIQSIVKQVKLPVEYGNTLETKIFLPSAYEFGIYEDEGSDGNPFPPISGRKLDYFLQDGYYPQSNTKADEKRKCYNNGTLAVYPTRTTWEYYSEEDDYTYYQYWCVSKTGSFTRRYSNYGTEYTETPRPAMILPSDTIVDGNFNVIA